MISAALAWLRGSKLLGYAITAFAAVAAVLIVIARVFSAGKASERAKAQGQILKDVDTRHEIDRAVAGEPDPVGKLQSRWSRRD